MEIIFFVFGLIFSASLASFYSTLAYRIYFYSYTKNRKKITQLEKWKLILLKPSHCETCNTEIHWSALIPIFGFLLYQGKCKICNCKINILYPILEIIFCIFYSIVFYFTKDFLLSIVFLFLIGHVLPVMYSDYKKFFIDYENIPFILFFGSILNYNLGEEIFSLDRLYIFLGFAFCFSILFLIYKAGIGMGDILFVSFFAALVGNLYWILFLNISYVIGILFSFIFRDKSKSFAKMKVPMGIYFSITLVFIYLIKIIYPLEM